MLARTTEAFPPSHLPFHRSQRAPRATWAAPEPGRGDSMPGKEAVLGAELVLPLRGPGSPRGSQEPGGLGQGLHIGACFLPASRWLLLCPLHRWRDPGQRFSRAACHKPNPHPPA